MRKKQCPYADQAAADSGLSGNRAMPRPAGRNRVNCTSAAVRCFTLIELLVVIAIIAIVVASKVGFFLQFSAIFAFKAL